MARGGLPGVPSAGLRGRLLAQPAPEGRRVRRVPVRGAAHPGLRQGRRAAERGRTRHLRRARLRGHAPERADGAGRVPLRALPHARGVSRPDLLEGPGLPALQGRRRLRRRLVPDAREDEPQARGHRGGHLRGAQQGDRARHLQRQAGDHQLPQDRPAAARRPARPRAHEALHPGGPRGLLRRHQRRERALLGPARELQRGRRGPGVHQRVGDLPPAERRPARAHRVQRDPASTDAHLRRLGHERARPGRGLDRGVLADPRADARRGRLDDPLLPPPRLAVVTQREIRSWLMDMDGVLVHEEQAVPGADRFLAALRERVIPHMVLTNNSIYTRRDLAARLRASGLEVAEESIWTSALATARFLEDQRPGGSAFVIGESGLTTALHEAGYTMTERDPDYVILGETRTYSFERITQAIRLIAAGPRFTRPTPDATGPAPEGPLPATGSVAALVSRATGVEPYYIGKPNPLMMRSALNAIEAHSETTAMIGDRMDTDVVSGLEAGLHAILVLTGISTRESAERFPF